MGRLFFVAVVVAGTGGIRAICEFSLYLLPLPSAVRHAHLCTCIHTDLKLFFFSLQLLYLNLCSLYFFHKYLNLIFHLLVLSSILCIPVSARIFFPHFLVFCIKLRKKIDNPLVKEEMSPRTTLRIVLL